MTAMMKETDITGEAAYDVETIRTDFPILFREVYGKPLVYLDNGASAQKPRSVLDAIDYAYKMEYANVHRGLHFLSNAATARYEDARETVRRFLNAPSVEEIIFTRNATEGINLVASSYGMDFRKSDEIVVSIMEHHSNIVPWHFHRERKGCVLKWAPIADDGTFLLDEFEKLLTKRTRMVAITHMSNVLGTVVPIKEVVKLAHARGIGAALDYMCKMGRERIARQEAGRGDYPHTRLRELNWLEIHGTAKDKGAIVSFSIDGLHPHDISTIIDRSGVAVRAGHHFAPPLMDRLGGTGPGPAPFPPYKNKAAGGAPA